MPEVVLKGPTAPKWVPLVTALGWIKFGRAVDPEEPFQDLCAELGLDELQVTQEMQGAWQTLAEQAGPGAVRGSREGERYERALEIDDLRNCRYFTWRRRNGRVVAQVDRYEDSYEGGWAALNDPNGFDYVDVFVLRDEILRIRPRSGLARTTSQTPLSHESRAYEWLSAELDSHKKRAPGINRTHFIAELKKRFRLNAHRASKVWDRATDCDERRHWRLGGAPRKTPKPKTAKAKNR